MMKQMSKISPLYQLKVLITQLCMTLCNPVDCNLPGSSVRGILHARILAAAKSRQSCPTLWTAQTAAHLPWDSPGKNTDMGCHFLLQCIKVKSESEVAQSCPTLSDPMDYIAHKAPPSMGFPRQEY